MNEQSRAVFTADISEIRRMLTTAKRTERMSLQDADYLRGMIENVIECTVPLSEMMSEEHWNASF